MKGDAVKGCLQVLQLFLIVAGSVHGDYYQATKEEVRPGKCPNYPSHPNFTIAKFNGTWIVAHQFQTKHRFLTCQKLDFIPMKDNENSFTIEGSVRTSRSTSLETDGESHVVNVTNPAYMRWSWNFFPSFIDHVTVLDTDYDNYAVIILCNDYGLLHSVYPILMTREKPVNVTSEYQAYFERAEKIIPFPVYTSWRGPQTCSFDRAFPDTKIQPFDVDGKMKEFSVSISDLLRVLQ